jgi:hypothetical protein
MKERIQKKIEELTQDNLNCSMLMDSVKDKEGPTYKGLQLAKQKNNHTLGILHELMEDFEPVKCVRCSRSLDTLAQVSFKGSEGKWCHDCFEIDNPRAFNKDSQER